MVVSGSAGGKLTVKSLSNEKIIQTFAGHSVKITVVSFSADGIMIASGDSGGAVKLWNVASGRLIRTIQAHNSAVTVAFIGADNASLLTNAGDDPTTGKFWNLKTGEQVTFDNPEQL